MVGADALSAGVLEQVPHEVEFIREDIPSPQMFSLMRNIDVVFHFAAKNCVSDCQNHPHEAADVNILGTLNIFEATRAAGRNPRIEYAGQTTAQSGHLSLAAIDRISRALRVVRSISTHHT